MSLSCTLHFWIWINYDVQIAIIVHTRKRVLA